MGRKLFGSQPRRERIQRLDTPVEFTAWTVSRDRAKDMLLAWICISFIHPRFRPFVDSTYLEDEKDIREIDSPGFTNF